MNKKNVVKILSKGVNIPKNRVERLLDSLQILILDALRKGEVINFTGFIKFYTRQRNERVFVNFQTGESFVAPAKLVPCVKFSSKFIESL